MAWNWNVLTPILLTLLVMVIVATLRGRLHHDHYKRAIRRSIRLGWPQNRSSS